MNAEMKKCPACGKETLVESNDIRYCGDGCGFVQEINPPESTRWLLAISANKEYWKSQFFEKLPVFIAHEYRRLWLMTCRPNVFCMVYHGEFAAGQKSAFHRRLEGYCQHPYRKV